MELLKPLRRIGIDPATNSTIDIYKGRFGFYLQRDAIKVNIAKNLNYENIELEKAIQNSRLIISRSGYTTIMDLAILKKKAFFIPTPGQNEQLYLAKRLEKMKIAPFCNQSEFCLEKLKQLENYSGFIGFKKEPHFKTLFSLFKGE